MKILIGTPIHISKDYCMERWLENVSNLIKKTPADLLLVDNSPDLNYVNKIKKYCKKYGITNYKIKHLKISQGINIGTDEKIHERITRSREIIRKEILSKNYDAWFCWESDQLIPTDALDKLIDLMVAGNFMVVDHNCWVNDRPHQINFDYGVTLLSKECLERYSFIPPPGSGPGTLNRWYSAERWFRNRLQKDSCNFIEIRGYIEPIYHLAK
jgi:hypothetical protein